MITAVWKNIKPTIMDFMTEVRARYVEGKRKQILEERKSDAAECIRIIKFRKLPLETVHPEIADYCEFPSVKAVIEQPSTVKVNVESFTVDLKPLWREIHAWRQDLLLQLASMARAAHEASVSSSSQCSSEIPSHSMTDEEAISLLDLAMTIFACKRCNTFQRKKDLPCPNPHPSKPKALVPLLFPQPIAHPCMTRTQRADDRDDTDPSKLLHNDTSHRCRWNTEHLFIDPQLSAYARRIIECAGKDPQSATIGDMDQLGNFFRCVSCEDITVKAEIFGWRAAVSVLRRFSVLRR